MTACALTHLNILVVEDSETDTQIELREFKRHGCAVFHRRVETADAFREALMTTAWDVILADYVMPRFSGLEALRLLQESALDIPFILISGRIGEETAVEAMKAGATDYLMKGNLQRLIPSIEREVKEAALRREKRAATHALRLEQERLQAIFTYSRDALGLLDVEGRLLMANPALLRRLNLPVGPKGDSPYYLNGACFWDVLHDRAVEEKNPYSRQALAGLSAQRKVDFSQGELLVKDADGTLCAWRLRVGEVLNEQARLSGYVLIMTDVTAEKAFQRNKEVFMATLTHDLKMPIQAEHRILELLQSGNFGALSPAQQEIMQELKQSNQYMYRLVENILATFLYEEDQMHLQLGPVELNAFIEHHLSGLAYLAQAKQQSLTFRHGDAPVYALGDAIELQRVLQNLVHNAIIYTPHHSEIEVSVGAQDGQAQVCVQDNGPGIAEQELENLFEQYHGMRRRFKQVGSGLGLYLCKKVIEAHHGEIRVESRLGQGSRFTVSLPALQTTPA